MYPPSWCAYKNNRGYTRGGLRARSESTSERWCKHHFQQGAQCPATLTFIGDITFRDTFISRVGTMSLRLRQKKRTARWRKVDLDLYCQSSVKETHFVFQIKTYFMSLSKSIIGLAPNFFVVLECSNRIFCSSDSQPKPPSINCTCCVKDLLPMAYFHKNFRSYTLPDNCPSTSLDIHYASQSHPASPYHPPFPKPPSDRLDALGLKARIAYGDKLRQNRNITPRTMRFINWWKERCRIMLNAAPFMKKRMVKEVEILDDEMQSRYDKIHGDQGLCGTLVELFNAMAELRMKAEYGDYLAYTCTALKEEGMNDLIGKIDKLDWQAVAERVMKEESTKEEQAARRLALSPTPYLDDIAKAAARLGYDVGLVRYQILAYADRNNFCHSGLEAMIHHAEFPELAERLIEDQRSLGVIFRGNPQAQMEMRAVMKIVEKEWFDALYIDETRKARVKFTLTDKAIERMKKVARSHQALHAED